MKNECLTLNRLSKTSILRIFKTGYPTFYNVNNRWMQVNDIVFGYELGYGWFSISISICKGDYLAIAEMSK